MFQEVQKSWHLQKQLLKMYGNIHISKVRHYETTLQLELHEEI